MNIIILNSSELPIYLQIKNQIIEQILQGEILEGTQLPSIRKLAKELTVSVITTKRAYEELENEGYIDTVPGKGSFVTGDDKGVLKQKQLEMIKNQVEQLVLEGKKYDITLEEMLQFIKNCYKET